MYIMEFRISILLRQDNGWKTVKKRKENLIESVRRVGPKEKYLCAGVLHTARYTERELTLFSNQITRQTMQLINGRLDKVNLPYSCEIQ